MQKRQIYCTSYVSELFDSMSSTYGHINYISSFGFTSIWRKACLKKITQTTESAVIIDLMSGMGELWPSIKNSCIKIKEIYAVDISPSMNRIARINKEKVHEPTYILQQDVLNNKIESDSADIVVSSFGLKTFNAQQQDELAFQVARILKPNGTYSFVEISVPTNQLIKFFYMVYLKRIIPLIGFLFNGNSEDYRMLSVYTSNFVNCYSFHEKLISYGLKSNYQKLFFGCATITWGKK